MHHCLGRVDANKPANLLRLNLFAALSEPTLVILGIVEIAGHSVVSGIAVTVQTPGRSLSSLVFSTTVTATG